MSHRFVTVRRGSPAARSAQIQPGDQLEAVEGRPVTGLQHRDLAQILRRAGNTLRLSITPKNNSLSDAADLDIDGRLMKGSRGGRSKEESRFYSVDLDRGPTGFGFSLRGGSEYNMGLYVLGLMEGGPAQRSMKIQVSDQLVEINGDSTAGMTHSQAVEQIRRGGHRIHLVLKKGNGYVPDYDPEEGALSPSSSSPTEEHDVNSLTRTTASVSLQTGGGRGGGGESSRRRARGRKGEGENRRRTESGGGRAGLVPPDLDLDLVEEEAREEDRKKKEEEEERRRRRQEEEEEKERRRKEKEEEDKRRMKEEEEKRRTRKSQTVRQKKRDDQREQGRRSRSLPRNGASSRDSLRPEEALEESRGGEGGERERRRSGRREERAVNDGSLSQRGAFSFLMPMGDDDEDRPSDSESAASFSEVSLSAASIVTSGWREDSDWRRVPDSSLSSGREAPGLWLKPSPLRLTQVLIGSRLGGQDLMSGLAL